MTSSIDKLSSTLDKLSVPTEEMEKSQQPFRLKLSQRLADPGGKLHFLTDDHITVFGSNHWFYCHVRILACVSFSVNSILGTWYI